MRSQFRLSLILAAAIFPTAVFAETIPADIDFMSDAALAASADRSPAEKAAAPVKAAVVNASPHYLTLEDMKIAFNKDEFEISKSDDTVIMYGLTAQRCLDFYDISSDGKTGRFSVYFKGGDANCLNYANLDMAKETPVGLSSADGKGTKMALSESLKSITVYSENKLSDKNRTKLEDVTDSEGNLISYLSKKDREAQMKLDEDEKRAAGIENDMKVVTTCNRGLTELDVASAALERLVASESAMAKILEEEGDTWASRNRDMLNEKVFSACKLQIERAKSTDIGICDERLAKLVDKDERYSARVKDLYLSLAGRYMNSNTMAATDAMAKTQEAIDKLRGMDLSTEEEAKVLAAEQQMYSSFLDKAAKEGTDSAAFKEISKEFELFVSDSDDQGCLGADFLLTARNRANPKCANVARLGMQLKNSTFIAAVAQNQQNLIAAQKSQAEQEQMLSNTCQIEKSTAQMMGNTSYLPKQECAMLEAKAANAQKFAEAQAKASANQGISTAGYAEVNYDTTNTANSALQGGAVAAPAAGQLVGGAVNHSPAVQPTTATISSAPQNRARF